MPTTFCADVAARRDASTMFQNRAARLRADPPSLRNQLAARRDRLASICERLAFRLGVRPPFSDPLDSRRDAATTNREALDSLADAAPSPPTLAPFNLLPRLRSRPRGVIYIRTLIYRSRARVID